MSAIQFRVHLRNVSGIGGIFRGHVDVSAIDDVDAACSAKTKLQQTQFPHLPVNAWFATRVEVLN